MRKFARSTAVGGVAAALAGLVTLGATPAGATTATSTVRTAVASWTPSPSNPGGPNVSLQVTEETGPTVSSLFFFVNESQCVANTDIFRSFSFEGSETELFVVAHNLSGAVLVAPGIEGTYTEETAPGCDPNGTDLTTVFSTTAPVSIAGDWFATGPASTSFPGNVVRPAQAAVLMSGPPALGLSHLGPPSFAQLSAFTS